MKAIIFAAGTSSRLGSLTVNLPKSCLEIIKNETVLDLSLSNLLECGFDEVLIVTGHKSEKIETLVKNKWVNRFKGIKCLYNNEFASKNNIYTAYLIKDLIDNSTFILNSDIVYDKRILKNAVDFYKQNKKSFLVVDDTKPLVDEDMKVKLENKRVVKIHKNQNNGNCLGEYIGILHLHDNDINIFKQSLESMIKCGETDKYYEDALDKKLDELNLSIVSTQGYSWTEIDTLEDYNRAKELECIKSLSPTN